MRRAPIAGLTASVAAGSAAACLGLAIACAPAADASAYRYWTYWQGSSGTWTFASAGPASLVPADGAVEGWRFAVTTSAASPQNRPRPAADFDAVCGQTSSEPGRKRVAVVIDPGLPGEAPDGEQPGVATATCVVLDDAATGYQTLRAVAEVRTDAGLVCAIAGYPADECAPVVDEAPVAATSGPAVTAAPVVSAMTPPADPSPGPPWAALAVVGGVAAVGAVLALRSRRA